MIRIRLIHRKPSEIEANTEALHSAMYAVDSALPDADFFKNLKAQPPDALIIDLSRLPAQGRDLALGVRHAKSTRYIPLIFVGGVPEKVARIKEKLPDAVYCPWEEIEDALTRAISHPLEDPVVPESIMAGYSGAPLAKKLGIKPGFLVVVHDAPDDVENIIHPLPEGARLQSSWPDSGDILIWFVRSMRELETGLDEVFPKVGPAPLWIAWPKKASGLAKDLTQQNVRETGLAAGLVDYKICAIDSVWSGLLFTRRKDHGP